MRTQHIGKEVVVAIPAATAVERDDEQIRALQCLERCLAMVLPGDGIAEWAGQPVEDRGLKQEAPDGFRLSLQDLSDQVVDDVAVIAGKSSDEAMDIVAP